VQFESQEVEGQSH